MTSLLLAPHNDDETLFAAYTVLRHQPHVVTCLSSHLQENRGTGITAEDRRHETTLAVYRLGASHEQLPVRDDNPDWEMLDSLLREIERRQPWVYVFAPAFEDGGHEQHNVVARLAAEIFAGGGGRERLIRYMTYRRGSGRSRSDHEMRPEPGWHASKFHAMSAYRSQINLDNTRPWFNDWEREWYAPPL